MYLANHMHHSFVYSPDYTFFSTNWQGQEIPKSTHAKKTKKDEADVLFFFFFLNWIMTPQFIVEHLNHTAGEISNFQRAYCRKMDHKNTGQHWVYRSTRISYYKSRSTKRQSHNSIYHQKLKTLLVCIVSKKLLHILQPPFHLRYALSNKVPTVKFCWKNNPQMNQINGAHFKVKLRDIIQNGGLA